VKNLDRRREVRVPLAREAEKATTRTTLLEIITEAEVEAETAETQQQVWDVRQELLARCEPFDLVEGHRGNYPNDAPVVWALCQVVVDFKRRLDSLEATR
jgi:hypothetical protein